MTYKILKCSFPCLLPVRRPAAASPRGGEAAPLSPLRLEPGAALTTGNTQKLPALTGCPSHFIHGGSCTEKCCSSLAPPQRECQEFKICQDSNKCSTGAHVTPWEFVLDPIPSPHPLLVNPLVPALVAMERLRVVQGGTGMHRICWKMCQSTGLLES